MIKEMRLENNLKNQTTFVLQGTISDFKLEETLSFGVSAPVTWNSKSIKLNIVTFRNLPRHISKKIHANHNRRIKITIELVDDEEYI